MSKFTPKEFYEIDPSFIEGSHMTKNTASELKNGVTYKKEHINLIQESSILWSLQAAHLGHKDVKNVDLKFLSDEKRSKQW